MLEQSIGKRIQENRKRAGLTQEQLAEKIGISTNYLSAVERGVYALSLEKLVAAMNILQCSADDLFQDVIDAGYKRKASILEDKLNNLPGEERRKILNVVEVMIDSAKK
ncbi:MAG: helix-turn-helix transcriptional regulator [Clostridia bacterium]|nr:helix-turn-helix transcriptional regulator [Clostridia bacterium]